MHVIDLASGKIVKNIDVAKRPRRLALTPDGKELWVTCEVGAAVAVIRTADKRCSTLSSFSRKVSASTISARSAS